MRTHSFFLLIVFLAMMLSCQNQHENLKKQFDQLKSSDTEPYKLAYAYATYLSTNSSIEAEEAVPMVLDLISLGYYTEARYCVDNLQEKGIHSWDLLALRGLCYFNELQPELAMNDLENAYHGDPENPKIKTLLDRVSGELKVGSSPEALPVKASHESIYMEGIAMLQKEQYDSALYLLNQALTMDKRQEYESHIIWTQKVLDAQKLIAENPASYKGYIQMSQGLASMKLYIQAQRTLTKGLEKNPENLNLILAKALVWVQAGEQETAIRYLDELEKNGLIIDPEMKRQILHLQQ